MSAEATDLGSDDELVADVALLCPLPNEFLGRLVLTTYIALRVSNPIEIALKCICVLAAGGIDEITAGLVIGIEELEGVFLVHAAHAYLLPLVANAHSTYIIARIRATLIAILGMDALSTIEEASTR